MPVSSPAPDAESTLSKSDCPEYAFPGRSQNAPLNQIDILIFEDGPRAALIVFHDHGNRSRRRRITDDVRARGLKRVSAAIALASFDESDSTAIDCEAMSLTFPDSPIVTR